MTVMPQHIRQTWPRKPVIREVEFAACNQPRRDSERRQLSIRVGFAVNAVFTGQWNARKMRLFLRSIAAGHIHADAG